MKQKKIFMMSLLAAAAMNVSAQKIDFNLSGKANSTLEDGYVDWSLGRVKTVTNSFETAEGNSISITATPVSGMWNNGIMTNWSKSDATSTNKLIFDGLYSCYLDADNNYTFSATEPMGIQFTISGLTAGEHSLCAYHNNCDNIALPPLKVVVNGETTVLENVEQTTRASKNAECGMSYVKFTVAEGEEVTVQYISVPQDGATYTRTQVGINALVFDRPNPKTAAQDPVPANLSMHLDCDADASATLSWTPGGIAVKHCVYIGTSADNMELVAEVTNPTYTVTDLSVHNTYYWRVDEVDAAGTHYTGDVWQFRPRRLAFPGAEGYGRFAQGGRGGIVYHVTNLNNDHNPGSLLYGLVDLEGPRTIVFDVSGLIVMDMSSQFVKPYATIAAQTAPGKGICLKYSNLNIGSDCICRFLRAKRGYGTTGNAMGASGADNTIIDHTTAAWGTDETFSSRGAKNLTFQYSMIAEALGVADHVNYVDEDPNVNHGFAATIDGQVGTYSHNLLVNCNGRNWSMGGGMDGKNMPVGQMDIFNNVCYNWWKRTTDGGCHEVNFVNNYYKMGIDTQLKYLFTQQYEIANHTGKWQAYVSGNIRENKDGSLTQDAYNETYRYTLSNGATDPNTRTDEYQYNTFVDEAFFPSYATIHTAKDAFKIVTSVSGATRPQRDDQQIRVSHEAINGTYTYTGSRSGIRGEIDHENDIVTADYTGFEIWPEESRAADFDTDQDGIPDWYEELTGTNPNEADNNGDSKNDGWTNLERYLDFMAQPYVMVAPGEEVTFNVAPEFRGFTNNPVFSIRTADNTYTAEINDSIITVKAANSKAIGEIQMTVTDGDGTTYTQRLGVAITGSANAVQNIKAITSDSEMVKREFFTLDGKNTTSFLPTEVYVMKDTYKDGTSHTMKVIMQ